jgi:NADH dehydrogenase
MKSPFLRTSNFEMRFYKPWRCLGTSPEGLRSVDEFCSRWGGPTGVELAGASRDEKKYSSKDYPDKDFSNYLFARGSPNVLNPMSVDSQQMVRKYLEEIRRN